MLETLAAPPYSIKSPTVLKAMASVPRHEFVPPIYQSQAYADAALPIDHKQTISQPFIVARMTELLELTPDSRVLEVGTGSGYQTAVLAQITSQIHSIEIIPDLANNAAEKLAQLGYHGIRLHQSDGHKGLPDAAPFDAIIVTCAPETIPQPLRDQLADNGKMMIPVGDRSKQTLVLLEKSAGTLSQTKTIPVRFVPMTNSAS
ncbi:MAG: protein-L-isoaspartate(D-aspartate) O-methyltransferase [Verrucomicrobiota bacterium]